MLQEPMTLYRAMHALQINMLQAAREGRWADVEDAKHTGTMLYQELRDLQREQLDGLDKELARHLLSKVKLYQEEVLRLQEASVQTPQAEVDAEEDGEAENAGQGNTWH